MMSVWKTRIFGLNALLFAALGASTMLLHWEGISEWWRFTSKPYEAVQDSPLRAIWSSGKIVPAALFFFGAVLNALVFFFGGRRK